MIQPGHIVPQGSQCNLVQEVKYHRPRKNHPVNVYVQIFIAVRIFIKIACQENNHQNKKAVFQDFHPFLLL